MPKFIRTDKGIFEFKSNMSIETGIFSFFGKIYNTSEKHLFRNDKDLGEFVSQADTIEELCDEFVLYFDCKDDKIRNHYMIEDELDDVNARLDIIRSWNEHEEPKVIYGAIWTDKGLIYVAKLNEKGDLELI